MTDVREALRRLVAKLEEIEAHPEFDGMWGFLEAHRIVYKGPNWADALDNARAALSTPEGVDALDARRYRWLKTRPAIPWVKLMPSDVYVDGEFDSAIDAAMQKDQESR